MNKKAIAIIIAGVISLGLIGCGGSSTEKTPEAPANAEQTEEVDTELHEKVNNADIDKVDTKEDIDMAYLKIMDKLQAKEQIRDLDIFSIDLNKVLEYANNASKKVDGFGLKGTEAIDTIDKLVAIDDLANNTTQDVLLEVIDYVRKQNDNGTLLNADKVKANQYLCRYVYRRIIINHPNMEKKEGKEFNKLYNSCKDAIRK